MTVLSDYVTHMTTSCFIYVIGREEGPIKVGISMDPVNRLRTVQTGCPFKVELLHSRECRSRPHAIKHEADFHAVYAGKRLVGEWFDLDAELAIELVDVGFEHEAHFDSIYGRQVYA